MAEKHELKAVFSSDTSGIMKGIKEANDAVKGMEGDMKDALGGAGKGFDDLGSKAESAGKSLSGSFSNDVLSSISGVNTEVEGLKRNMEGLGRGENGLERLGSGIQDAGNKVQDFGVKVKESIEGAASRIDELSGKFKQFGGDLTKYVTAPIVGMSGASIGSFMQVEGGISKIAKTTGAEGKELKKYGDNLRNVMRGVPESAEEVGTAIGLLGPITGLAGKDLEKLTKQSLQYARVNETDVGTSTQLLGQLMNATETPIEEMGFMMDKLTKASQDTGIGVDDLVGHILNAGPSFEEMGYGLDESIALFSQFTKMGAEPAEVISSLDKVMNKFAEEGVTDAKTGFKDLMKEIQAAPSQVEALSVANEAFGARVGGKIAEDIRSGAFEIDDYVEALLGAEGQLDSTAKASETFADKIATLKNQVSLSLEPFGGVFVEVFTDLIKSAEPLLKSLETLGEAFMALPKGVKEDIVKIIGAVALLGPVFSFIGSALGLISSGLELFSEIGTSIKWVGKTITKFGGFLKKVGGVIGGVLTSIASFFGVSVGVVVAVIAVVIAAIGLIYYYWDEIVAFLGKSWDWVKEKWSGFSDWAKGLWEDILSNIKENIDNIKEDWVRFKDFMGKIWEGIKKVIGDILAGIATIILLPFILLYDFVVYVLEFLSELWEEHGQGIRDAWESTKEFFIGWFEWFLKKWEELGEWFSELWESFKELVSGWVESFLEFIEPAVEWFRRIWDEVLEWFTEKWETVKEWFSVFSEWLGGLWESIVAKFREIWDPMVEWFTEKWEGVKEMFTNLKESIGEIWDNIKTAVTEKVTEMVDKALETFTGLKDGAKERFDAIKDSVGEGLQKAVDFIKEFLQPFKDAGGNIMKSIGDGIAAAWTYVRDKVVGTFEKIRNLLPFSPPKDKSSPLVGLHKNGIVENIVEGIERRKGDLDNSMRGLLSRYDNELDVRMNVVGSGDVGLYDFDRELNQAVNSQVRSSTEVRVEDMNEVSKKQPANINLTLGRREFGFFVEDINEENNRKSRRRNS